MKRCGTYHKRVRLAFPFMLFRAFVFAWLIVVSCEQLYSQTPDAKLEFFENNIRPVLVEHCYECHNSIDQAEADLALDWKGGIRAKLESGVSVVPGSPGESMLLRVINHEIEGSEMPESGAKLSPETIANFKKWIEEGAVDPRLKPPTKSELAAALSWEAALEQRKKWWSFRPISKVELPLEKPGVRHPVDRFIRDKLDEHGLASAEPASKSVLLRRLCFALTGLPPTQQQMERLRKEDPPLEVFIDELIASPHFGERWARHWMDVVRYADSHGSEGDPDIPYAYRYRDYLIRAFNADVPFDQLVREHVAGDLLGEPRINNDLGINESAIGPAHLRLCFHGFAPTDALDEKVRFTDDQINVLSKAFLGLTVSCARCHDHKFDAISQADYYAMFGVLGSCTPAIRDAKSVNETPLRTKMRELKSRIKKKLIASWQTQTSFDNLSYQVPVREEVPSEGHSLSILKRFAKHAEDTDRFKEAWKTEMQRWFEAKNKQSDSNSTSRWRFEDENDTADWFFDGDDLKPSKPGEFVLSEAGNSVVSMILPAGIYTHTLSRYQRGVVGSPRFKIGKNEKAWVRQIGGGQASVRYVIQNYPRGGTVYPIKDISNRDWGWQALDLSYWEGDEAHLEWVTAQDAPIQTRNKDQSWFGIREVVISDRDAKAPTTRSEEFLDPLFLNCANDAPESLKELELRLRQSVVDAVNAWESGNLSDAQADLLTVAVRDGILESGAESLRLQEDLNAYRELEKQLSQPYRIPAVHETVGFDQPLFDRGDHKRPLEPVRRRFLEAIDNTPYETQQSGRLELANDLVRADNPLTSRVIVNRIWHHLFGKGIVATPDNFGLLGSRPSHPELLDFLAAKMVRDGWSIKKMVRFIVTSKTWQRSSLVSDEARQSDPENEWLSHANLRRLDAEAIRDSMLLVTGELNNEMFGPSFAPNSQSNRRSVYVKSKRNNMDRFLAAFDSPVPFAPTGARSETNVPAQSLTLLNSPYVTRLVERWSDRISKASAVELESNIGRMFDSALSRQPTEAELAGLKTYYRQLVEQEANRKSRLETKERRLAEAKRQVEEIIGPVRTKLLRDFETDGSSSLRPVVRWRFDEANPLKDTVGGISLSLKGTAKIKDGALVLNGSGMALSQPIDSDVTDKTLEVWVQLDSLKQQGGGVLTIQTLGGHVFDSITFAELKNREWLAGSDFHRRTMAFDGDAEKQADQTVVHLAIVYKADGTIIGYRNGVPYGRPIRKSDMQEYAAGKSQLALGIRHGTSANSSNRMLQGKIYEARFYDYALDDDEINASYSDVPFVSKQDLIAAMSSQQRVNVEELEAEIETVQAWLQQQGDSSGPRDPLARIAHAIFNLKEFIYVR